MSSDHENDSKENVEHDEVETVEENVDIYFEPIVSLKAVEVKNDEDDNDLLLKLRAKLYRFHKLEDNEGEWKERGTGDVKLLQNKESHKVQLLMRRDKTYKVCALHVITESMQLKPCLGSDKAWLWSVYADYADGSPTSEVFAIKFLTTEAANQFKKVFEESQVINKSVNEGTYVPATASTSTTESEAKSNKAESEEVKEKEEKKEEIQSSEKDTEQLASKLESTAISKESEEN